MDAGRTPLPCRASGGVAVFIGLIAAMACAVAASSLGADTFALPPHTLSLLGASTIIFAIGLLDDLRGVPPVLKLLGQTLAALIVCQDGFAITQLSFPPHYVITLGWLSIPLTVAWLVGVSNAFNLVDGLDGLAGGVGVIVLATITAAAAVLGNTTVTVYSLALAGALLGFLRYNAPPARIFLGDSGSLVVGFLLAFLAVKSATRHDGTLLTLVPIFALSYPLLDTGLAMLRRWLRGHPLSRADGRHIHHQLQALGLSSRKSLAIIYTESAAVAVLGLSVTFAPPAVTVAIAAAGGAILLFILVYGVRWLEYDEFLEAGTVLATAGPRARVAIRDTIAARDISRLIAFARTEEELKAVLVDSAELFRFEHLQLGPSVSAPPAHAFGEMTTPRMWKVEYPIITAQGDAIEDASGEPICLTFWCSMAARVRAASADRVAQILAPAIVTWAARADSSLVRQVRPRILSPTVHLRAVPSPVPAKLTISGLFATDRPKRLATR